VDAGLVMDERVLGGQLIVVNETIEGLGWKTVEGQKD